MIIQLQHFANMLGNASTAADVQAGHIARAPVHADALYEVRTQAYRSMAIVPRRGPSVCAGRYRVVLSSQEGREMLVQQQRHAGRAQNHAADAILWSHNCHLNWLMRCSVSE